MVINLTKVNVCISSLSSVKFSLSEHLHVKTLFLKGFKINIKSLNQFESFIFTWLKGLSCKIRRGNR